MSFLVPLAFNHETLQHESHLWMSYTNQSGKFLSKFVWKQNLLALSGNAWKEPGNVDRCPRSNSMQLIFVFTVGMLLRMWLMTSHSVSFMKIC